MAETPSPETVDIHAFYQRMAQTADTLPQLYDAMEGWSEVVVQDNPILECQKGCARCCMHQVLAGEQEWGHIHTWMRENLSKEQRLTIIGRVTEQRERFGNPLARWLKMRNKNPRAFVRAVGSGFRTESTRCPMLGPDNRCEIYPVRPFVCRAYGRARMPSGHAMICEVFAGRFRQQERTTTDIPMEDMSIMSPKYFELGGRQSADDGLYTLLAIHLLRNRTASGDLAKQPTPLSSEKTYPVVTRDDFPTPQ